MRSRQLVPDNVSAGVGNLKVVAYSGLRQAAQHWVYMDIQEGSYGGRPGKDGLDAVDTLYANTRNNPIEDIESHYPLRVTRYELNVDTGGAGALARRARHGSRDRVPRSRAGCRSKATARVYPPPGLFGGGDGTPGRVEINRTRRDGVEVPSKFPYRATQAGDRLLLIAPVRRRLRPGRASAIRARSREDVADGVLSPDRARELYGFEG